MIPIASNLNSLIYLNVLTPENPAVTAGGEVHPTAQSMAGPKKKTTLYKSFVCKGLAPTGFIYQANTVKCPGAQLFD